MTMPDVFPYFGEVNYTAVSHLSSGNVVIRIQPPQREPANLVLHVRPPARFGSLRSVMVNGKPWTRFGPEAVDLGALTRETTVNCQFK